MNITPTLADRSWIAYEGVERRRKPRIYDPFQTEVQGVDANGEAFEFETVLDNLSAGGLYLRLTRRIEEGAKLLVIIRLPTILSEEGGQPRVVAHGVVVRTEPKPGGACGVGVFFMDHYFL